VIPILLATRVLIGEPFPAQKLPQLAGATVTVPAAEHVVVVDFFATWCGPCHEALPILVKLREKFGDRVTFVFISEDEASREKVARFAADFKLGGPVLLDADHAVYDRVGVRKLPTTYIIDSAGIVRHINNGFGPGYEGRMTRWLRQTLEHSGPKAPDGESTPPAPVPSR
jgi:thiol-disulfide isomerase/thioredoxin